MDLQNKRVLTLEEACEYLGYKRSYVLKMTSKKMLPFSKPNGKRIFFDRERLESWMLNNATSDKIADMKVKDFIVKK